MTIPVCVMYPPESTIARSPERTEQSSGSGEPAGTAPAWVGNPTHFRWLAGIVRTVIVLNLCDAVLTLLWVEAGFAREANPLIREIVENHPLLFVVVKLGVVMLSTLLLWRLRARPLAVVGIFSAFLVYYWILVYHLSFASFLLGQLFES